MAQYVEFRLMWISSAEEMRIGFAVCFADEVYLIAYEVTALVAWLKSPSYFFPIISPPSWLSVERTQIAYRMIYARKSPTTSTTAFHAHPQDWRRIQLLVRIRSTKVLLVKSDSVALAAAKTVVPCHLSRRGQATSH